MAAAALAPLRRLPALLRTSGRCAAPVAARAASSHGGPAAPPPQHADASAAGTGSSTGNLPFIERAKLYGANALIGTFLTTESKFDRVLKGLEITRMDTASGEVEATIDVTEGLINAYGGLHGGATCTIVDVISTISLLVLDPLRAGVTVELNASFTAAAKLGESLRIVSRVLKTGKRLGFTEVQIWSKSTGKLIATGRHVKAL